MTDSDSAIDQLVAEDDDENLSPSYHMKREDETSPPSKRSWLPTGPSPSCFARNFNADPGKSSGNDISQTQPQSSMNELKKRVANEQSAVSNRPVSGINGAVHAKRSTFSIDNILTAYVGPPMPQLDLDENAAGSLQSGKRTV